jgi:hypothetical protein
MAGQLLGVMRVECVVAVIGTKNSSKEFNLRAVAKDILDNHCSEWTMDGGNWGAWGNDDRKIEECFDHRRDRRLG